jgi:hypothetical protein
MRKGHNPATPGIQVGASEVPDARHVRPSEGQPPRVGFQEIARGVSREARRSVRILIASVSRDPLLVLHDKVNRQGGVTGGIIPANNYDGGDTCWW